MSAETLRKESTSEGICSPTKNLKVRFSLSMLSEDLEMDRLLDLENIDDDCFADDFLPTPLGNMTFNLLEDHDSEPSCGSDHQFNEIVVMSEQANFVCVNGKRVEFIKEEKNLFLKQHQHNKYIATFKRNSICLVNEMSAKITIFHVKYESTHPGYPVVLNFTDTNNVFCCTETEGEKILTFIECDKTNLGMFVDDKVKSPVFFMSQTPDGFLKFESALHRGWYIHSVDGQVVKMRKESVTASNCFHKIKSV